MEKPNAFKIVSIAASLLIGVLALLIFSGKFPGLGVSNNKNTNKPTLEIWGTLPEASIRNAFDQTQVQTSVITNMNYTYVDPGVFTDQILRASAQGFAPDLIIANSNQLLSVSNLTYTIPYKNFMTELEYKSVFIDGTHQFATPFGALFYPTIADPIINIYNKKTFN